MSKGTKSRYIFQEGGILAPPIKPTLNDYTWDEINQISALGGIDDTIWEKYNLHVGDAKAVNCTGSVAGLGDAHGYDFTGTQYCFILGFNHNKDYEGTGISFCFGRNADGQDIDYCSFEYGGNEWDIAGANTSICKNFYNCLPQDLQKVIKPTRKYTYNRKYPLYSEHSHLIFYNSEFEILGNITKGYSVEADYQKQYEYYKTHSAFKVDVGSGTEYDNLFSLRSPVATNREWIVCLNGNGGNPRSGVLAGKENVGAVFNFRV